MTVTVRLWVIHRSGIKKGCESCGLQILALPVLSLYQASFADLCPSRSWSPKQKSDFPDAPWHAKAALPAEALNSVEHHWESTQ